MSEEKLKLYEERVNRQVSAIEFKEHDRVPFFGLVDNWMLSYCNLTVQQAWDNHELERDLYNKAVEEFQFDYVLSPLIQLPSKSVKLLGGIADTDSTVNQIQTGLSQLMKPEEYDDLIANPTRFLLNNIVGRRHPNFLDNTPEQNAAIIREYNRLNDERGKQNAANEQRLKEEFGVPVSRCTTCYTPVDFILDYLRDFKGIMVDIRRMPEKVKEASLAMLEPTIAVVEAANPTPRYDKLLPIFTHIPGFLSAKSFEKVYWQQFKQYVEHFAAKGHRWGILFEKDWTHLYDFLVELPPKQILGFFENDDIRVARKKLDGVICVAGGVSTFDLNFRTVDECVDATKRLIDDCAPGGGFVLAPDKIMHTATDGRPENLKAVIQTAIEYGKY